MRTGEGVRVPDRSNTDLSLGLKSFSSGLRLLCPSSFSGNDLHAIVFIMYGKNSVCREEGLKFITWSEAST